ncbi:MAG: hypothetical protein U5K54_24645 [Cytophagales bacterium]|nr:hypothetical protein [Cytophagales bacterium]
MKSVSDYSFHFVEGSISGELEVEIVKLWTHFAALQQSEAERRLSELVLLLKDKSGKVIGVSTVVKTLLPQIQNYVYAYRSFILSEFRAPALDTQMIVRTKNHLQEISIHDSDKKCVGIMVIVQNEILKAQWRQAVWLGADMIFIGNTPQGHPIRIGYFKNARI